MIAQLLHQLLMVQSYILVLSTTGLLLICPLNILNHQNFYTLIIADGQIHLTIKAQLLQKLLEDISHK